MNLSNSEIWSHIPRHDILISLADFALRENVQLYVVGGTVRDVLLGKSVEDLDFAASGNAFAFARGFASLINAAFVPLDEEHDTARVVLRRDGHCMDFSGIRGTDIIADMLARDFTINAMAVDISQILKSQEAEIIDPLGGIEDLNNKIIRLASPQSIKDDPIRILRAYRFAAVLSYRLHNSTAAMIRDSVSLLDSISVERIRDELFKILAVPKSVCYLEAMDEADLLERIFPEIIPTKGMEQNEYHHLDVWGHSILTLDFLEQDMLPVSLKLHTSEIDRYLQYEPVKGRPRRSLLKMAALLHDIGKPATRTIDRDGRIRFFDHNKEGAEIIYNTGERLKLATRETEFLSNIIKDHMYPLGLCVFLRKPGTTKEKNRTIRRFIQRTEADWLAILLISFADLRATQGPWRKASDLEELSIIAGEIADTYFQEISSPVQRLVTGNDLMSEFKLPASPDIGRLLKQVEEAQMDGKIRTREEAIEMVRNILLSR